MNKSTKEKPKSNIVLASKDDIEESLLDFLEQRGLTEMFLRNTNKVKSSRFFSDGSKIHVMYDCFSYSDSIEGEIFWTNISAYWVHIKYGVRKPVNDF